MRTPVQTRHHGSCWARMEVSTKEVSEPVWLYQGEFNKGKNWTLTGVREAFCLQNSLTSFVMIHCNQKRQTVMTLSLPMSVTLCRKRLLVRIQFRTRQVNKADQSAQLPFLLIFLWIYSLLCENNQDRSSREFTYRTHSETKHESQAQIY